MNKRSKLFFQIILIVLAGTYLTFWIDVYTLNTWLKRVFVFGYFIVVSSAFVYLKQKYVKKHGKIRKSIWGIASVLSVLILIIFQNTFLPLEKENTIYLRADGYDPASTGGEIWLVDVEVDGKWQQLSQLADVGNAKWIYRVDDDNYMFLPSEDISENLLSFTTTGKSTTLYFGRNTWSGIVYVSDTNGNDAVLNLYGSDGESDRMSYTLEVEVEYALWERLLYNLGALAICCFILSWVLAVIQRKSFTIPPGKFKKCLPGLVLLLDAGLLFCTTEKIDPSGATKIFLLVLTLLACAVICGERNWKTNYCTRGKKAAIIGIAVYSSIVSFAQRFFLDGNTRMHFSAQGCFYVILGVIWFIPIVGLLLRALEGLTTSALPQEKRQHTAIERRKAFIILFLILCACQTIVLWAFWPGGFPSDNISQVYQAFEGQPLNDWHPVLSTLSFKLIYWVIPNIGAIPAVQAFCFALLCTAFLMMGYDRGMSLKVLVAIGSIFILLPNQAISAICPEKDYPYMLSLLWGTYLLVRFAMDMQVCRKPWFLIALTIDMFLIRNFRHNGLVPYVFMILLCIGLTIFCFQKVKFRLLTVAFAAVLAVGIYRGPVFSMLQVSSNVASPYTTMLCAIGSCVNKDLPLSEKTNVILESVMPLEDWRDYYSRYYGHDIYMWGRGEGKVTDTSKITAQQAFSMYFEALRKYPDVIIKDRLDGMDLMWDISQPEDSFNLKALDWVQCFDLISEYVDVNSLVLADDGNSYYNPSLLANAYRKTVWIEPNRATDMLLWRTGAYLIFYLVLCLFWHRKRILKSMLLASVPLLGNIASLTLLLYHQSFRYVYAIQVLIMALFFCTICICREKQRGENDERQENCCTNSVLQ